MNIYKDVTFENTSSIFFNNKNVLDEVFFNDNGKNIKISKILTETLYFYFINELVFEFISIKSINYKNYIENNLIFLDDLFYFLIDKILIKNIINLENEFSEYVIYEGYDEIISLFYFGIKHEEIEFKHNGKKLELSSVNSKKIKHVKNKIKKIFNKKIKYVE